MPAGFILTSLLGTELEVACDELTLFFRDDAELVEEKSADSSLEIDISFGGLFEIALNRDYSVARKPRRIAEWKQRIIGRR